MDEIQELIERWVLAVGAGDLDAVVADHAEDIVMFDVPPPENGVRGLDAYRQTWPPFFEWLRSGAVFELVSLEVTAGEDVAFAVALLRCGQPADVADRRLRLTLGLRREDGRWVVAHEHHSFTVSDSAAGVEALHKAWFGATAAKDLDTMMAGIADDVVSYEHEAPLEYVGVDAVRAVCATGLDSSTGTVTWDVPDLRILVRDDLAVSWGLNRMTAAQPDGTVAETWSRGTRVFRRSAGEWLMVHQHVSWPVDTSTGKAHTTLRP
ncbi:YybH family protein [Cryptosporangium aurantiacum]|uniref:Ketosteroid isomerase homolog n=1 Tax=Cryptosporangium aurantiacum TaxID=134849 RepID=A0A1M7Q4H3_9ACTN|nr:nuclear transport factor 2 family protein [Cryptosporangium aurantiacum]SHN25134.1 Ketosteroid isomerase homolog [Cryptosporangium aurantiacum]